jgi:hypothetical protein
VHVKLLQVPWWSPGARELFSEMTPIFKNASISLDDLEGPMREYAEEHGQLNQPRRALIGSYFGSKMLLATPLLKW